MSKERLEKIKSVSEFQIDNDSYYGRPANVTLKGDDVKWLIEQAGIGINTSRDKQALIRSNIALNKRVQELEENLEHGAKVAVETARRLHQSQEQNKRYREVIEEAIEYANSPKILTSPAGIEKILSKALEDEE